MTTLRTLPKDFGKGWMSSNAADLCRIVTAFTDVSPDALVRMIHRIHPGTCQVNVATVERALSILEAEK
jgi:hypothetical protein